MSVRFSQLLVAIVLALLAVALFRTVITYQETGTASDLRMRVTRVVERETLRLGGRIEAIESLAANTAIEGYVPKTFEQAAQGAMQHDPALRAVDFFNADDVRVAHIEARSRGHFGRFQKRDGHGTSAAQMQAIELALFDAALSRSTSLSDIPAEPSAAPGSPASYAQLFLATRVVRRGYELGSIVEFLDVRRLIVDDLWRINPGPFALDDGRGRLLQTASLVAITNQPETQTFPIPFADRVLQLTVAPAHPVVRVSPWWFVLAWIALVFAICLPIEVVGHINRRVQALNEELETRVAARTRQLEESLSESRRLAAVVESVHEGVMRIDAEGIIRYVNAALCREAQCTAGEIVGRPVSKFPALGLSEQQLADIREAVSESGFVYREMERWRAGGMRYVAGVTFTRHSVDGPGGLIAVSRDVTDRRRLVDELLEAKTQLEREGRARADFIGTASHELRTPVTTLRTLAALLLEKLRPQYTLSADDATLLDVLNRETRRLAHLVDDLLKIAKIDAPEATLAANDVDLRSIVCAEVEEVLRFDQRAGPRIELHLGDAPTLVRGDEEALRSVVNNLVGNARKFTPPSGSIDVSVEPDADRVRLIVADSGVGISKSDLPHIFERFYRARQTATDASGAGLGLAIVARLVDLMDGRISVASEVGRGTTVTIEYPRAVAPEDRAASRQAAGTT